MLDLMSMLPLYYRKSKIMRAITDSISAEIERLRQYNESLNTEFCIDTADESIEKWERSHAITPIAADEIEKRRARVKAKMRDDDIMTETNFKNLLRAYVGEVEISVDSENGILYIELLDVWGIPQNNDDIIYTIEENKPAHLMYAIKYLFSTWQAAANKFDTFEAIQDETWLEAASHHEDMQGGAEILWL